MTASPSELVLADFKLVDSLGRPMEVTADGVVSLPNGAWGRIARDGKVTDPQGNLRARLIDGRVVDSMDKNFAFLAEDGTAKVEGKEFRFDGDGKLALGSNVITLTPADSPARRAAMLAVLVATLRPAASDIDLTPKVKFEVPAKSSDEDE